ncbi:MAG: mechanosensitive ion channel family protein, partial [Muribaculaceae bacterium]|nr:mechanosensitive ion channel family protein [Muribaculaceae bacterium]
MKLDHWILDLFGLEHNSALFIWIYAFLVFLIAVAIGCVVQTFVVWITREIGKRFDTDIYSRLRAHSFFKRTSRVITPIVFIILIQFTLTSQQGLAAWLSRFSWIYVIYLLCMSFCIIADVAWEHIDERENKRKLPLKGLVQLVKGIIWIFAAIICVAIIVDKSPTALLAGLGAFSAVLMLVFKDNILGVVAGVQLSENDSLHVGDWIKVPGTDANGSVMEVTLTSVKVQNWDKT